MSTLVSNKRILEKDILESPFRIAKVGLSDDNRSLLITLNTGLQVTVALTRRLSHASVDAINSYHLIGKGMGIHWEEIDEDLSLRGILQEAEIDFQALREQTKHPVIDVGSAKVASMTLRAVNHKLRQQIISILHVNEGVTASAIYQQLKLEQAVAVQHLAILRRAKLIKEVREGGEPRYQLNYDRLKEVNQALALLATL